MVSKEDREVLAEIAKETKELGDESANLEIESKEDYEFVLKRLGKCYEAMEFVEKSLRPEIDLHYKAHKAATSEYNALIKPIKESINAFKTKIAAYLVEAKMAVEKQAEAAKAKLEAAGIDTGLITTNTGMNVAKDLANEGGMSLVDEWSYEIVNPELLPREYLMPDLKKISARVRSMKSESNIPGVKVTKTATLRRMGGV